MRLKPYEIAQTILLDGMLDRRRKLSDKDKRTIRDLYSKGTISQLSLAKMYHVSRSLIGIVVNPQRADAMQRYAKEHWHEYYLRRSPEEIAAAARNTRQYKYRLYKAGIIKEENHESKSK